MDIPILKRLLEETMNPATYEAAERQLQGLLNRAGFGPALMLVIRQQECDIHIRQAASICLKKLITQVLRNPERPVERMEAAVQVVKANLVEALIEAPECVQKQLAECIGIVIEKDFPNRWPELLQKIRQYMRVNNRKACLGALLCMQYVVKDITNKFQEFQNSAHVHIIVEFPKLSLALMSAILYDISREAMLLQKQALKLVHYVIKSFIIIFVNNKDFFATWMKVFIHVLNATVPPEAYQVAWEQRAQLPWWKAKKWAAHNLLSVWIHFKSFSDDLPAYVNLRNWYVTLFAGEIAKAHMGILEAYKRKQYVAPRFLQLVLLYMSVDLRSRVVWDVVGPHVHAIVTEVLFPIMCVTDEDEALWESDADSFMNKRLVVFDHTDCFDTADAARLLITAFSVLGPDLRNGIIASIQQVLRSDSATPRQKTGALMMLAAVEKAILDNDQRQELLTDAVNALISDEGYLRATACWVVGLLHASEYTDKGVLAQACAVLHLVLCRDQVSCIRYLALEGINKIARYQRGYQDILSPLMPDILRGYVNLICQTGDPNLLEEMDDLMQFYGEGIQPFLVDTAQYCARKFGECLPATGDRAENDARFKESKMVLIMLENMIWHVTTGTDIFHSVEHNVMEIVDYSYAHIEDERLEYVLVLHKTLTESCISPTMWEAFAKVHSLLPNPRYLEFGEEVMCVMYNYIIVDKPAFRTNGLHLEYVFQATKKVLVECRNDEFVYYAGRIMEVMLLEYQRDIDCVVAVFCEQAMTKLMHRDTECESVRICCLQVLVAALLYNPAEFIKMLNTPVAEDSSMTALVLFIETWFMLMYTAITEHGCKLFVVGLCALLGLPENARLPCIVEHAPRILQAILRLLQRHTRIGNFQTRFQYQLFDHEFSTTFDDENELEIFKRVFERLKGEEPQWCSVITSGANYTWENLNQFINARPAEAAEIVQYDLLN